MTIALHVLSKGKLLETFHLEPGLHLLGSGLAADLVLAKTAAPEEACRVELAPDGRVLLRTRDDTPLKTLSGTEHLDLELHNGDSAEIHGLRLVLLVTEPPRSFSVDLPRLDVPTAPSTGIRPPIQDTLAIRVRAADRTEVIPLDGVDLTFGRGPGHGVCFIHGEVSRGHARLFRKPDSVWIQDTGSSNGTFLNGSRIDGSAEWRMGGRVTLSSAPDAPMLELVPYNETLANEAIDGAVRAIVGRNEAIDILRSQLLRNGKSNHTVLLLGENGTGKDLGARALATSRGGPYIPIHCGALPENLIESYLFGHRKGAFTGASLDQPGACEEAKNGTLFLDEIGELPLTSQAKLLRLLESGEFTRVGETRPRIMKARVVAATNRNLLEMVKAGTFREDLFHRLNVIVIRMPPLRAHVDDIPRLAGTFLGELNGVASGGKVLSEEALKRLIAYPWPGNVRELRNTLHRAAQNFDGPEILAEHLEFTEAPGTEDARASLKGLGEGPDRIDVLERELCADALLKTGNNVTQAAQLVGKSQSAFRRCLARHGLLPAPRGGTGET